MDARLKILLLLHRMCCFHAKGSYMSQVNVNKKKKRSVPITPQNELPNGQFSVALFTYLEKKIQVKSSTFLGHAIYALTILLFLMQKLA